MQFDQMKRRDFITLVGGAVAWPLAMPAQSQPKMLRVGFVGIQPREAPAYTNFLKRMAELGYQQGRNFANAGCGRLRKKLSRARGAQG
jgi:putative tryptophan/tyrosine transport system substrate-binding protein